MQNVNDALKEIAAQANSTLSKREQIHLSAHMLRHTTLRKAAEKDIRYIFWVCGVQAKLRWSQTSCSRSVPSSGSEDQAR